MEFLIDCCPICYVYVLFSYYKASAPFHIPGSQQQLKSVEDPPDISPSYQNFKLSNTYFICRG